MGFDVCLTVRQCTAISHRYLRWLTGGGGHFLAVLSKLGVVSCPLSQECVETVSIVPELVFSSIAITWRLSSVVCKLFTFQASSPKPLGRLEPNLAGMFIGWSSTNFTFFVLI